MAGNFGLVLTSDPPAVDIFRKDEFKDKGGLFEKDAIRQVQRPSWKTPLQGRILRTGTNKLKYKQKHSVQSVPTLLF